MVRSLLLQGASILVPGLVTRAMLPREPQTMQAAYEYVTKTDARRAFHDIPFFPQMAPWIAMNVPMHIEATSIEHAAVFKPKLLKE